MFFNDRRNKPVESKRVGKLRSIVTGAQEGSYTAPKNMHFGNTSTPSDYRVESFQRKRGNTYKNLPPKARG